MPAPTSKIVVITGVTRGLGRAMAIEFARLGHTVLGCGRKEKELQQLKKQLGPPHHFTVVNVASDTAVQNWAQDLAKQFPAPDLLLNNAAIINRNAPLWKVPAAEFDSVVDINIKGVTNVLRHFLPAMIKRQRGVIVNFSSGWGRSVSPEVAPYCATKWAIEGLTKALAEELPEGMAAVPLNPGVINTEMLQSCFGPAASHSPGPVEWAARAVPDPLGLSARDNGHSVSAP